MLSGSDYVVCWYVVSAILQKDQLESYSTAGTVRLLDPVEEHGSSVNGGMTTVLASL